MRITCSLLWTAYSAVDGSVMHLVSTDSEGSKAVISSLVYAVHIWRLPLIGRKDWCVDGGWRLGFKARRICFGITPCHWPAFELRHWLGYSRTSFWGLVSAFTICSLLVVIKIVMACGYSHFLLLLATKHVHGLESWLCSERGPRISWFVFDKWPTEVVFFKRMEMKGIIIHSLS